MLLVILPPLALFLVYEARVESLRGDVTSERIIVNVEEVIASNSEGTNVRIVLDGNEKKLFFHCKLEKGGKVTVAKDVYENGETVYHSTECRY